MLASLPCACSFAEAPLRRVSYVDPPDGGEVTLLPPGELLCFESEPTNDRKGIRRGKGWFVSASGVITSTFLADKAQAWRTPAHSANLQRERGTQTLWQH